MSREARKKMSENHVDYKKDKHPQAKKVICITTGEIFNCMIEAAEKYNISYTNISHCCRGKHHTAGKHPKTKEKLVWRYYDE